MDRLYNTVEANASWRLRIELPPPQPRNVATPMLSPVEMSEPEQLQVDEPASGRLMLIFDGACGFCTWAARWIKSLDRHRRVAIVPFQKPGVPEQVGLTRKQCEKAAWAVEPDGTRHRGAAAIHAALAWALGFPSLLRLYDLPIIRPIEDALYACIAASRKRLPGVIPYCEQHPEECR